MVAQQPITRRGGRALLVGAALLLSPLAAREASAETAGGTGYRGLGPVLGVGADPDQFHVGLRFDFGELSRQLDLRPGFEFGVGDDRYRAAMLVDALYRFRTRWDVWQPYAGGGIGVGVTGYDDDYVIRRDGVVIEDDDRTDVDPGINLIGGVARAIGSNDRFQTEVRFGIGEAPDIGLSVGWLFR